jgi:uncharacterized coiled-coil DUF342 family protein
MSLPLNDIKRIEEKLQQLIKSYQQLKGQHVALQNQTHALQQKLEASEQDRDQLQQQVHVLKAGLNQMTPEDKKQFEKQLNQYIRDIDQCINLLST